MNQTWKSSGLRLGDSQDENVPRREYVHFQRTEAVVWCNFHAVREFNIGFYKTLHMYNPQWEIYCGRI